MPDPHTPDVAAQIAAELDALIKIVDKPGHTRMERMAKGLSGLADWRLYIEPLFPSFVSASFRAEDQALIVGWVMAECTRRGWGYDVHFWPDYRWEDGVSVAYNCCITTDDGTGWDIAGEVTHPTSLALAALRAYRQACEAEVQHG